MASEDCILVFNDEQFEHFLKVLEDEKATLPPIEQKAIQTYIDVKRRGDNCILLDNPMMPRWKRIIYECAERATR